MRPTFDHPYRAALVLGDVVVLALFSLLGRRSHSMGNAVEDVVRTALPFGLAWFAVALVTGAFGERATDGPAQAARRAALTWLFAFPLGLGIRSLMLGRGTHWSFAAVAGSFLLVAFAGWRALAGTRRAMQANPS